MAGLISNVLLLTIQYVVMDCTKRTFMMVYKPYGFKMCRQLCEDLKGTIYYIPENLSCRQASTNKSIKNGSEHCLIDVRRASDTPTSSVKPGLSACSNPPKAASETLCKRFTKLQSSNETGAGDCILRRQENFRVQPGIQMIKLNMFLKTGMKLSVYGASIEKRDTTRFIIADPKNLKNQRKWFLVIIKWKNQTLEFVKAFHRQLTHPDVLLVIDRFNFTLACEVTQSDTHLKIYIDGVIVKTVDVFSRIGEVRIDGYSQVHAFVVQKTGKGCENVDNGIPAAHRSTKP